MRKPIGRGPLLAALNGDSCKTGTPSPYRHCLTGVGELSLEVSSKSDTNNEAHRVPLFRPCISPDAIEAISQVLCSGHLTTGARCAEFEVEFARRLGVDNAVSVCSGSAALHLALAAIGVGLGDAVFIPTLAFAALGQAVEWQQAAPILVDSEPNTLSMDPAALSEALDRLNSARRRGELSLRPRAVIVIDYGGQMADYTNLRSICDKAGLVLIEDAAHTMLSYWRASPDRPWRSPGQVADIACFSFYANKCMTTGEGGMVVTNNSKWARAIRSMRLHGLEPMGDRRWATWLRQVIGPGFKYNLSDIAAALGLSQLSQVEAYTAGRRRAAQRYGRRLSKCTGIRPPVELPDRRHSWHLYVVRLTERVGVEKRNAAIQWLDSKGIGASVHWYPLHLHSYYGARLPLMTNYPVADAAWHSIISLPIFPSITDEEVDRVADSLITFVDLLKRDSTSLQLERPCTFEPRRT